MEWQPIDGDGYEVSQCGIIRRADGLVLKQWKNDQGYMLVRLNNPRRVERVHRLVAAAFLPNPGNKPFVNHVDNCRSNNNASNLEWCTQWENLNHAAKQGRMQRDYWTGRRSPNAKITDSQAAQIRAYYEAGGISWEALARDFNISKRSVGRIVNGETYV